MKNKRRDDVYMPDTIEVLGTEYDGSSKDWYADSAMMDEDVRGIKPTISYETELALDYGEYYDREEQAIDADPMRGIARPQEDEE